MRISTAVLSVFLIIYVAFQMTRFGGSSYSFQTVYETAVEETLSVTGIFFRDEKEVKVSQSGVLSCNYAVGEKVPIGSEVARLYKNQEAIDLQREISSLQSTLQSLTRAQDSSKTNEVVLPETLNAQVASTVSALIIARDKGDLSDLSDMRTTMTEYFARRQIVVDADTDYTREIERIQQELYALNAKDTATYTRYKTSVSGFFVDHIDGFEKVYTADFLEEINAEKLDEEIASYTRYAADSSQVKIVKNHNWQYVFTVTEDQAIAFREGRSIQVRFPNQEILKMTIKEMRRDVEYGKYMIVLEGDVINPYILTTRVQSCELLINTHEGLKVPKTAIRYEDGVPGVYVVLMDKMYFRTINVIYETEEFIVSSAKAEDKTPLKLYDTIIVEGVGLYHQKDV